MTRWPPPLRRSVPLLLLGIGLLPAIGSVALAIRASRNTARQELASRARILGTLVGGTIDEAYRLGRPSGAQRAVERLLTDRQLDLGALIDENGRIVSATRTAFEGLPTDSLGPAVHAVFQHVQRDQAPSVEVSGDWLVGLFPVRLGGPGELIPNLTGVLLLQYRLAGPLSAANRTGFRNGLVIAIGVLAMALAVGLMFRTWVTRRAEQLVGAARALAGGALDTPVRLGGSDELAQVAEAIASLASDLARKAGLEEQLRQAQRMEAVGRLAGGVAHDFNNILTVIIGHVVLALETIPDDNPRHRDLLEIRRNAERAALLTRQLLAFGRRQVIQPELLSVNAVVAGIEPMLARLLGPTVDLDVCLGPEGGAVRVDASQLEQIVVNLAVNARDAMPTGGTVRITTDGATLEGDTQELPAGAYMRLAVADTGMGIPASVRPHIFEPFFTTKDRGQGTGLGLATVHGIACHAGGNVLVTDRPGGGSVFEVLLPIAGPAPEPAAPAPAAHPQGHGELILLVDDEPAVLNITERILTRFSYRVLQVSNATAAEALFRRHVAIRLVITDVLMPDVDGPMLAARLATIRPEIPVLFVSGYADAQTEALGSLRPQDAFLTKPVPMDVLVAKVHSMLAASAPLSRS